ncbi:MAG: ATP-binding protein [Actinomycetales bacterium]|nr:ATP-binding protein [Actinomycetales bacterium]
MDATHVNDHAVCLDGRRFRAVAPLGRGIVPGDLVVLTTGTQQVLGQVHGLSLDGDGPRGDPTVVAEGDVLGLLGADGVELGPTAPFVADQVQRAGTAATVALQEKTGATIPVATRTVSDGEVDVRLRPGKLNRHTFLCGQSGSGKTYALGVLLEQMLVHTGITMVVLDLNADFVRLYEVRTDADPALARALEQIDVRVLRPAGEGTDPLVVRYPDLDVRAAAAAMRLDPLVDRDEYEEVLRYREEAEGGRPLDIERLRAPGRTPEQERLHQRLRNLGVLDWQVWAQGARPVTEILDDRHRATVLDLSGFAQPEERLLVALAVLDHLWAHRAERRPTLVVIDEAHNVCSAAPDGPLQAAATERLVQIAGEGRKYGLWLLLSTQRPSKIHPNVLSQCDNLALMRMNGPSDLAEISSVFGFAPPELVAKAARFGLGEVLLAGGFVPVPTVARMGSRLTAEGGADVPVPRS